jgi:thioredoxin reductase
MKSEDGHYDVIIVGGSYSGISVALALGRSLRRILIIDNTEPCNRFAPYSHNFLTQDGNNPSEILHLTYKLERYLTIEFLSGLVVYGQWIRNCHRAWRRSEGKKINFFNRRPALKRN